MNKIPVIEVDHGIANNFGTYIEVNKNLKDWPELYKQVMKHEYSHTDKAFSYEDFKLDFFNVGKVNSFGLIQFMATHPKSFTQFLPIYYTKKKGFVYDLNLIIMYVVSTVIIGSILLIGGRFL